MDHGLILCENGVFIGVELNVATVATFNTQNEATLRNFNPPPGLRFAC